MEKSLMAVKMADKKRGHSEETGPTIIALPDRKDLLARKLIQIQTTNFTMRRTKGSSSRF